MKQVLVNQAMSGVYFKASSEIETLDEYNGQKGQFLRVFAINDKRNKNGWKALWRGTRKNLHTFKGKPGIEFMKCDDDGCDLDHTEAQTKEMSLEVQEPFRVTTTIDFAFDESTHTAYFIDQVNDPEFFERVKKGEIKYVSPSIWPETGGFEIVGEMDNGSPMIDVWDWSGLHHAFVTKPAFGDEAKITATCEGVNCPVKLLTASEKKVKLIADALQDCVSKKIGDYGQKPDDQKIAIFYSECREGLSGIVDQADLPHLQQVPLLINHNKKKRFIGVTQRAYIAVQKLLENESEIGESQVFDIIRQDKVNSSFSSCTCSGKQNMTPEEEKEMKSKLEAAEHDYKDMKSKFAAQEEEEKKNHDARVARLVATLKAMPEDEREKHMEAVRAMDDEKEKTAMDEAEKEVKTATKGMQHKEDDKETEELKSSNALMQAKLAEPMIAKMAEARQLNGATEEEIETFKTAWKDKPLKAVEEKYNDEKIFTERVLSAAGESQAGEAGVHFAFMGSETQALSGKSLEDIFEEAVA